jgi:hypothetical protein
VTGAGDGQAAGGRRTVMVQDTARPTVLARVAAHPGGRERHRRHLVQRPRRTHGCTWPPWRGRRQVAQRSTLTAEHNHPRRTQALRSRRVLRLHRHHRLTVRPRRSSTNPHLWAWSNTTLKRPTRKPLAHQHEHDTRVLTIPGSPVLQPRGISAEGLPQHASTDWWLQGQSHSAARHTAPHRALLTSKRARRAERWSPRRGSPATASLHTT